VHAREIIAKDTDTRVSNEFIDIVTQKLRRISWQKFMIIC